MALMKTTEGETVDFQTIFNMVALWADKEMRELWRQPQQHKGGLFMGVTVYGAKYFERFQRYCLDSMLAGGNLAVLRGNAHIAIFTERMGFGPCWELRERLWNAGIDCTIHEIPAEVMVEADKHQLNRYWVSGTAHNLAIQMAGRQGRGFHPLWPDHVTCQNYYVNLLRLSRQHEGVAQTSLSATEETVLPELNVYRDGHTLIVPDRDLGDMAYRHLHKQMKHFVMNGKDIETEMVRTTWLGYRGRDSISLYSPHMNPTYMSPGLCVRAKMRIPATIDAELPSFMPAEYCYVAEIADGITFIEVSDDNKLERPELIDFAEFAASAWGIMKFNDAYLPYITARGEVPVHPQDDFMSLADIEEMHATIMRRVVEAKPAAALVALSKIMDMGGEARAQGVQNAADAKKEAA
jgi:hypothetical protein